MAFVPENRLEEVMARAATDVLAAPLFYELLMSEPLVVAGEIVRPSPEAPPEGMNLAMIRYNGRVFHPIFTSLTRLRAIAPEEGRHFVSVGRDFFLLAKGANFLINPNSEMGKAMLAHEVAFWLDPSARTRRTLARNPPQAKVSVPAEPPRKLVEALKILFANRHDVVSAHLLDVEFSDRDEPRHPLVAIEAGAHFEKLASEVSQLAAAVVPELIIDLVPLDRNHLDGNVAHAIGTSPPLYSRNT